MYPIASASDRGNNHAGSHHNVYDFRRVTAFQRQVSCLGPLKAPVLKKKGVLNVAAAAEVCLYITMTRLVLPWPDTWRGLAETTIEDGDCKPRQVQARLQNQTLSEEVNRVGHGSFMG